MKTIQALYSQFSLLNALKFIVLESICKILCKDSYLAYSQTGEDIIINDTLKFINGGFYVEVGSNEPIQHSNTFKLYQKGWRGITIDANQNMVNLHKSIRKNDIPICAAISDNVKDVIFYEFEMDEISTIDSEFYRKNVDLVKTVKETSLRTCTLDSILTENLPNNTEIDLLSIDVEGHDYQVLNSLDLRKHRPKLIVIEMHSFDLLNPTSNEIYNKLVFNNYSLIGYAVWNGYFVAEEFKNIN